VGDRYREDETQLRELLVMMIALQKGTGDNIDSIGWRRLSRADRHRWPL
jgi:hypothetical protein